MNNEATFTCEDCEKIAEYIYREWYSACCKLTIPGQEEGDHDSIDMEGCDDYYYCAEHAPNYSMLKD